ncbi:MAG: sugar-binding protein [Sedimentisphaerales bacterium]|nr:sugar-binding protein [Sedimentisphaerales bacterium]
MGKTKILLALVVTILTATAGWAKTPAEAIQEAIFAEEIEGDLVKAMGLYDGLVEDQSAPRSYRARALYRKANCQLKAQDMPGAIASLERLVKDFEDQAAIVEKARQVLQDLTLVDLASFMPPQTMLYVELGSPGRQIQTILNMFKGTPLEDPLAMVAGTHGQADQLGPEHILANLLNPSMMAEFKKIRGLALGVVATDQGHPAFILVLYPGKSDAIRGLLLAFLGAAGVRIKPVAGMEAVRIRDNMLFACHDENVILISNTQGQLEWAARRHKGLAQEPSLIQSNKSFASLSKQARQDSALTVWVDLDKASKYAQNLPGLDDAVRMGVLGGLVDANSLEDLTAQLALRAGSVELGLGLGFKEGSRCLAYDLVRTPPLDHAALMAVPAEAIAVLSVAFPDPQSGQAKATQERLAQLPGADIARVLLEKVRQITLFVKPEGPSETRPGPLPPVAYHLGMIVTSRSAAKQGPLARDLADAAASNKLLIANVGGLIELAGVYLATGQDSDKAQQAIRQLSQVCKDTTLKVRTVEQDRQITLSISLDHIPPLRQLWGPIGQIVQLTRESALYLSYLTSEDVLVTKASTAPTIDGAIDEVWSGVKVNTIQRSYYRNISGLIDFSASFRSVWDANALYLLVEVSDEDLRSDSSQYWQDDCVEIFVDPDNSKSSTYGPDDLHFYFVWGQPGRIGEARQDRTSHVRYAFAKTDKGYNLEVCLPWTTLGVRPTPGTSIGLEVQVNDDDDGGDRDHKVGWNARQDNAWEDPSTFGNAYLAGLVAWWRLDEKSGDKAYDSSGNGQMVTLHGDPVWMPSDGKIGGALALDGIDDWVETGYATDLPYWTVAVWVRSPASPTDDKPSGPVHRERNFQINWNHVLAYMRGAAGVYVGDRWYSASFGQLQAETWYHLVATFEGQTLKAYRDGALITATRLEQPGKPDHEAATMKLGRHAAEPYFFRGIIDDVRIYSYALSDGQVQDLYNNR